MDDESQTLNTLKKLNENNCKDRRKAATGRAEQEHGKSDNEAAKVVHQGINKRQSYNYPILFGAREKMTLPYSFNRKYRIFFPISHF